jgi:hypothetical protein
VEFVLVEEVTISDDSDVVIVLVSAQLESNKEKKKIFTNDIFIILLWRKPIYETMKAL